MKKFTLLLTALLSIAACNKTNEKTKAERYESHLPNYGNLPLNEVFTAEDSQLQHADSVKRILNTYYDKVWDKGNLSGGVIVAKGDSILLERYRGFARENKEKPIGPHTAMHVASVSKPMTAMAVMKLIEAGKLQLKQPLTTLFPGFPYPDVTVEMLLKQRSGLPKYEHFFADAKLPRDKFITNEEILQYMIEHKPGVARAADTGFMYCNTNFALLALIVEKVTKTPFPAAMQEMVFKPLKMTDSFIFQEQDINSAAQSFFNNGTLYPLDNLDLVYGDKNVYTTPRDLLKFSTAMFSKDFLRKDLMDMIFEPYSNEKPGVNNYGIGFRMKVFDNGEKLTYHNGWWHGSNAVFAHLPKSKVTVIAIGNKYSQRVYSALSLTGLFEDFPIETKKMLKSIAQGESSVEMDKLLGE